MTGTLHYSHSVTKNMYSTTKTFPSVLASLALLASSIIGAQIGYTFYAGDTLCFNEGCGIVEQLTTVPPLYFNGAGLLFFLTIYIAVKLANKGSHAMRSSVLTLLTAAMGAEAALISFQYLIAQEWCSYCLVIFTFIVLLNFLAGGAQVFRGLVVFLVVAAAFFSLNFGTPAHDGGTSYEAGVLTTRPGHINRPKLYLFFSSTCPHCENVIDTLALEPSLTVHFNPIDEVTSLDIENREPLQNCSPEANKAFLQSLGITQIPVLLQVSENKQIVITGEYAIHDKIRSLAGKQQAQSNDEDFSSQSSSVSLMQERSEDGCSTEGNCEDGAELLIPDSAPQVGQ